MQAFPIQIKPDEAAKELAEMNKKVVRGLQTLSSLTNDDVQVGTAPKTAVFQLDKMVLYRHTPVVDEKDLFPIPVLISYALVNRPSVADLQENRSLIRNLLKLGIDVYLIDWGYPTRADRWLTMGDYVNSYIDGCVDYMCDAHGLDQINLLGICQGGTMSLCYTSLHPEKIKNLIVMVTPVDFHARTNEEVVPPMLNTWGAGLDADLMIDAMGNVPGDVMNFGFLMLQPFNLNIQKYTDMVDIMEDQDKLLNFLRMEEWIFDSPDQAGEMFRQFIKDFFQQNKLIKGEVELDGQRVNLQNIKQPVLNIYAEKDHLVPPPCSQALRHYVGAEDYTEKEFPVGHIGMYVSGKAQRDLAPTIADWIRAHAE
ncbi:MAG: class III poly(R)-hydroxyalkanoic acid synthase subunit PhaC [Chloroflexaceae bacterium]|nr:class III poly(R)-hydroxyalkanoic acid synthase subunit PhaC [Chloroflexaceae bacterium]NJO04249.1 class III poly(R)-hydroxyalkanoic acid synthase subunit PhaC [Chloroflexaceae bacterium]